MALCRFCLFLFKRVRLEHLNATRISVAAVSSMTAYIYLCLSSQMQTSLATGTKFRNSRHRIADFISPLFTYGIVHSSKQTIFYLHVLTLFARNDIMCLQH